MASSPDKLDKTDLKILRILQENGRITNLSLSQEIGLSPAPTLERVKKLENAGIIQSYHAVVDDSKVGLQIQAFIQVSLTRQVNNAIVNFKKQIHQIPEVMECYQVTGNADYVLKVIVPDISAFEELISEKLSSMEEIGSMQTTVILSETKLSRTLPLKY
ncbi:MAG: Lrp/AsnC family transcriptional regulator [Flavobacteriales bacterium]|nr:Lrp/AsnC family transcriptional regulator [Flavobacteriales bacterium]MCB9449338.1 Lrp/AsnC family transcriptional regulator [Flavobacteriales bacterium]